MVSLEYHTVDLIQFYNFLASYIRLFQKFLRVYFKL